MTPCTHCGVAPAKRRTLCWTCYEKHREAGLTMPPAKRAGRPGAAREERLLVLVRRLSPERRAELERELEAVVRTVVLKILEAS